MTEAKCPLCAGDLRIAWQEGGGHSPDCEDREKWSKSFRIVLPDYTVLDGIQFPSGRCVVDHPERGLMYAAVSVEELPPVKDNPDVVIGWEPRATFGIISEELNDGFNAAMAMATAAETNPALAAHLDQFVKPALAELAEARGWRDEDRRLVDAACADWYRTQAEKLQMSPVLDAAVAYVKAQRALDDYQGNDLTEVGAPYIAAGTALSVAVEEYEVKRHEQEAREKN